MSISEEVTLEYIDNNDPNARWRRLCSRCDEYGESRARMRYFRPGVYDLTFRATDPAGQTDSVDVSFDVT